MTTAVTSSTNTTATSTSSGSVGATTAQEAQDRFLKLLVAQLNNQDPMNPLDNAQMTTQIAQINTVTGIQQLNETVEKLLGQYNTSALIEGASLVGREVLVQGNRLQTTAGNSKAALELETSADSVRIEALSPGGEVVGTSNLGARSAGRHSFEVDTSAYTGSGALSFRITGLRAGQPIAATPLERARVDGVSMDNNALSLQLNGRAAVPYTEVRAVL